MVKLTESALNKLKEELEQRISNREEITQNIKTTREMGDLRENTAYHDAKDKQGYNEGRIMELNVLIKDADIVEESHSCDKVGLGSTVELEMISNGMKVEFQVVSFNEADPGQRKISDQSPLGEALMNKCLKDEIEVEAPNGLVKYKIINIK